MAVETIAETLIGTGRPFVFASGVAGLAPGRPSNEADPATAIGPNSPRGGAEHRAFGFIDQGVRAISARFSPTVHGMRDHGFIAYIADVARRTGTSAYVGDGGNAWAAVHVGDAARLVRLGLERAPAGARLHAVGEDAVPTRKIAEAIGARLGLPTSSVPPEDALNHFGFIGQFFGMDLSSSSAFTQAVYDWKPTGPTLLEDIAAGSVRRCLTGHRAVPSGDEGSHHCDRRRRRLDPTIEHDPSTHTPDDAPPASSRSRTGVTSRIPTATARARTSRTTLKLT